MEDAGAAGPFKLEDFEEYCEYVPLSEQIKPDDTWDGQNA